MSKGVVMRGRIVETEAYPHNGPGKLCQALSITADDDGTRLVRSAKGKDCIYLVARRSVPDISVGKRIGISRATSRVSAACLRPGPRNRRSSSGRRAGGGRARAGRQA